MEGDGTGYRRWLFVGAEAIGLFALVYRFGCCFFLHDSLLRFIDVVTT